MPQMRKPTEVLLLNGTFQKNKSRTRDIGPKSEHPVGDPPSHLDADHRKVWREIVAASPVGVLTSADRVMLELVVRQTVKMRNGEARANDLSLLSSTLSKLGFTPADRSRINAPTRKDDADDLDFLN